MRSIAVVALLCLLLPAAHAAEEPEAVYAKFHDALHTRNVAEMQRHGTPTGGKELADMAPIQRKAILEFMANLLPKTYSVAGKEISPDGNTATLRLTAQQKSPDGKTETVQGIASLLKQGGEWKVDKSSWGNQGNPKPSAAAPAARPASKAQAATRKTPVVGSIDSAPERKLGAQKAPCVYKPVMTNEDIQNCR